MMGDGEDSASYRLVAEAPEGPAAEAFRNLRASLSLLGPEDERRVFLFTSAVPSEGKSFSSANYALALAQQGHQVLLIDGDLRRPNLHKIFRASGNVSEANTPGIVDCLVGATDLQSAVRPVSGGRLEPNTLLSDGTEMRRYRKAATVRPTGGRAATESSRDSQ
jgi:Mrp family chromosome partitioning ATPase